MNKIKKRRLKKKILNNKVKIIIVIIIVFILSLGSAYALLNQRLAIGGTTTIGETEECTLSGEYTLKKNWGTSLQHYLSNLTITNNSNEDLYDWTGQVTGPNDIEISSGHLSATTKDDNVVTIVPMSWNSTIKANSSITVELDITTVENNFKPTIIKVNGCTVYDPTIITPEPEPDPTVALESLAITPDSITMTSGETLTLIANKTPANAMADLTWTSSNPSVATVSSDGTVAAVSAGTSVITVSSGEISATSTINVIDPITPSDINIEFVKTAYWESEVIQFKINITNNGTSSLNKCSFSLGVPAGTTYIFWSNFSNNENTIISNNSIAPGTSIELRGQLSIPSGYNAGDYLTPSITNITVE